MTIDERQSRTYAAIATVVVALLLVLWMAVATLRVSSLATPESSRAQIVLDEEFIEVADLPLVADLGNDSRDASAQLAEESAADAQPAPESGSDSHDAGNAAPAPPTVTAPQESTVKAQKKPQTPSGPEVDKKKAEEEAIARQANDQTFNAFRNAQGSHNAANGRNDDGNAGRPSGNSPQGSLNGRGTGQAGGGWSIPNYAAVPSPATGSVKITVTIDREGRVTKAEVTGGDAPAATTPSVVNACLAEVRSKRFTRPNAADAPETAKAYITYTFR